MATTSTENTQETGAASCEVAEGNNPQELSATEQVLIKYDLVQKASKLYTDMAGSCRIAKLLGYTSRTIRKTVLQTSVGKKADEIFAKAIQSCDCENSKTEEPLQVSKDDTTEKPAETADDHTTRENIGAEGKTVTKDGGLLLGFFMTCMHMYFRFFPPMMFLRWSVHACLMFSQCCLALSKDLARIGDKSSVGAEAELENTIMDVPVNTQQKETSADTTLDTTLDTSLAGDDNTKTEETKQTEAKEIDQKVSTSKIGQIFQYLMESAYAVFMLVDCFFLIPYFTYQTFFLQWLDNVLYDLAGLKESDDDKAERQRVEKLTKAKAEQLSPKRRWVVDVVINVAVGQMLRFPVLGHVLKAFGVARPVRVFRRLAKLVNKEETKIVHYLQEDPKYDEKKDPDYVPEEVDSDDSLEYKDDEDLDADITTSDLKADGHSDGDVLSPKPSPVKASSETDQETLSSSERTGSGRDGTCCRDVSGNNEAPQGKPDQTHSSENSSQSLGTDLEDVDSFIDENVQENLLNQVEQILSTSTIDEELQESEKSDVKDLNQSARQNMDVLKVIPKAITVNVDKGVEIPEASAVDSGNIQTPNLDSPNSLADFVWKLDSPGRQIREECTSIGIQNRYDSSVDQENGNHPPNVAGESTNTVGHPSCNIQSREHTPSPVDSQSSPGDISSPEESHLSGEESNPSSQEDGLISAEKSQDLHNGNPTMGNPDNADFSQHKSADPSACANSLEEAKDAKNVLGLDQSVLDQAELEVGISSTDQNKPEERPPGAFLGISGMYSALFVHAIPMDPVDPMLSETNEVTYIKDGQEFSTAEAAGFNWDLEDPALKSPPLKPGWLAKYIEESENDSSELDLSEDKAPEFNQSTNMSKPEPSAQEEIHTSTPESSSADSSPGVEQTQLSSDVDTGEMHSDTTKHSSCSSP